MLLNSSHLVLAMLAVAACQAASIMATDNQESTFSRVKSTEIIQKINNEVIYMPPMMIIGNKNGSITRCPIATPENCELYHNGNSPVTATLVHGEYLFAALKSGTMLRCLWERRHSCYEFNKAGTEIVGLATASGYIHAGLRNGAILRCHLDTPWSCSNFAEVHRNITSLAAFGSFIYAGSLGGRLDRCSLSSRQCILWYEIASASGIHGIVSLKDTIYALRYGGVIQYSSMNSELREECILFHSWSYSSLALYDRKLYIVKESEGIFSNNPGSKDKQLISTNKNAVSISVAYGTFAMQNKYRKESQKCIWQAKCPPTVAYYDVHRRAQWEVSIENGTLYDSQGVLLDTSDADESHSQRAAIFVMGPDGQLLVSKYHERGVRHTSSLMAGSPVSGAGLIVVKQGRIKNITACSVHYRPDLELNEQVKKSLYLKGYKGDIDSYPCTYRAKFCSQDDTNNV